MRTVQAVSSFPESVHEAQTCWSRTDRWPAWVDGLARVVALEGDWPKPGSEVIWESGPAGRGRVRERVASYEPLAGQTVAVEDDSITGLQAVSFSPAEGGVEVRLTLQYALKRRSLLSPLVDALFIRRAMEASLRRTLARFGSELSAPRQADLG